MDNKRNVYKCLNGKDNNCSCTYSCEKRGACCDCLKFHRDRGEFPACFFNSEGEKTYDRSYKSLQKYYKYK